MRAIVLTRHGGPEVLRVTSVPTPSPAPGEVRVKIRSIGVNFAEVLSRRGLYGWAPSLPYILGMEAFGMTDDGSPVIVGTQFGTYAEFICVPSERALTPPRGYTPAESAAFAVNYLTAWIGLMEMARLRPTDTVLVTSAAGGVGTAAVQIASRFGCRVIGASSHGHDAVASLGASAALDYRAPLPPVDVVLEMAGGAVYRSALRALAPLGRIVLCGASGAFPRSRNLLAKLAALRNLPRANVLDMLRRSYGVMSFHAGWLLDEGGLLQSQWRELVAFVEEQGIRPVVGRELPFEEMAEAHRVLEGRGNVGKVVVHVS